MKQKLLLTLFIAYTQLAVNAQKASVYAITGTQKGSNNWTEVRLIDIASGQELKSVYKSADETQPLNARTGKPIAKKDFSKESQQYTHVYKDVNRLPITGVNGSDVRVASRPREAVKDTRPAPVADTDIDNVRIITIPRDANNATPNGTTVKVSRVKEAGIEKIIIEHNGQVIRLNRDGQTLSTVQKGEAVKELESRARTVRVHTINKLEQVQGKELENRARTVKTEILFRSKISMDKPFSTYSAACAYDKKHERLYYTPMGIAQLRYIDLKAKTPQVYYFEDEQFGALRGRGDISNQITRMVIGADGNGYALSNNADHLIRFTTGKKPVITDLGSLTDDASNSKFTVHSAGGYGGDIIAANNGDLYLIQANHNVFQINIKNMTATYRGTIQGLPRGYSTNGAAVEEGTSVLVNSSNSTQGYYRFDIKTMMAEKVENGAADAYNASDLANGNLLNMKKETKEEQLIPQQLVEISPVKDKVIQDIAATRLGVYPNPVTNSVVNLLMDNYAAGRYQAKLIDVSGKQLGSKTFTILNKSHKEPFNLPASIAKGNYLIQLFDNATNNAGVVKLVVQ